jgi:hypothetical protein
LALATFLQLFRPQTLAEQHARRAYRSQVDTIAARVRAIFDEWVALREIEPDYARLANVAAVNRWELLKLHSQAERLSAPRMLGSVHRDVLGTITASARACQLLANGYRFHKSEAICDGQAMLVDTLHDLDRLALQVDAR